MGQRYPRGSLFKVHHCSYSYYRIIAVPILIFSHEISGSKINGSIIHQHDKSSALSQTKSRADVNVGDDHSSTLQPESELSLELMDTQDKLRRTAARVEILEIIQMEMSESLSKIDEEESAKKIDESDDSQSETDDQEVEGTERGDDEDRSPKLTVVESAPVLKEITFDDIMNTVQDVRALVAERGTEHMITGSLLATPSAIVPLQDVEDNKHKKKITLSAKNALAHGVGEEKSQSPTKGILSKASHCLDDKNEGRFGKKIQVASLIQLMNSSIASISDEVGKCEVCCISTYCQS